MPAAAGAHDERFHPTAADGLQEKLPDLIADPPTRPLIVPADAAQDEPEGRLLLRFDGHVHNRGPGPLEMEGRNPSPFGPNLAPPTMGTVVQNVDRGDGTMVPRPSTAAMVYETNDDHKHWHFKEAARYSLWSSDGAAEVAPAQKAGFCLTDSEPVEAPDPSGIGLGHYEDPTFCQWGNPQLKTPRPGKPQVDSVVTGISGGWRDTYSYDLFFQWIDISNVAPGAYQLRNEADPFNIVVEADEVNPPGVAPLVIPGYRATPGALTIERSGASPVTLSAQGFASGRPLGAAQLTLVDLPEHGKLTTAAGTALAAGDTVAPTDALTYTPTGDTAQADRLSFSAREAGTPFPLTPPVAQVTLTPRAADPGPDPAPDTVAIGGVQGDVIAGTSIQLTAVVTGKTARVEDLVWQVLPDATHGTVSAGGRYVAPAQVPADGLATVRASLPSGASAEVRLRVVAPPPNDPAPMPRTPETENRTDGPAILPGPSVEQSKGPERPATQPPRKATPTLSLSTLRRTGFISVSVVPRYTGRLKVAVRFPSGRRPTCSALVRAGQPYVCRLAVARRDEGSKGLRVVATLKRLSNGRRYERTASVASKPKASARLAEAHGPHVH
ncbi:MAG TPA: lysyl oxidase family protein [Solirubrobacteraceae bacterium]|nr:lysyl oxidase family protein [Solirubrobacteraceae bacterium]